MAVVARRVRRHAGIVTLEDVVEEIVGDICDEHDRLGARARQRRDGSWSLSGLLRPDEVEDVTGIELPEDEDYDTVAGLVLQRARPDPGAGDVAEVPVPDRSRPDEDPPQRARRADRRAHGRAAGRPARRCGSTEARRRTEDAR